MADKGEEVKLKFHEAHIRMIQSTNLTFNGFLTPKPYWLKKWLPWKKIWGVNWIENLTWLNKFEVFILMYSYTSKPASNDGTYVVMEFLESRRYIFAKKNSSIVRAQAQDGSFTTPWAGDITTPNDPRVFLKKGSGRDVMFTSCVASQPNEARFITLFEKKPGKAAKFLPEGNSTDEAQRFQLAYAITKSDESTGDDDDTTGRVLGVKLV